VNRIDALRAIRGRALKALDALSQDTDDVDLNAAAKQHLSPAELEAIDAFLRDARKGLQNVVDQCDAQGLVDERDRRLARSLCAGRPPRRVS
jgi:hypothetical protein